MSVYPVSIKNQSTLYIKATKPAITAKMKSLGIKNFTIQNAVSKAMMSKIKLTPLSKVKAPSPSGLGKGASGPNNPGMKPDFEAQSKLKNKQSTKNRTVKGSGVQKKKDFKLKNTLTANKQTPTNKQTLNQKISELAKKVKRKTPNVSMGKITDTIRGMIRKKPLTAVAGAGGLGIAIGAILSALKPTKVADATLTGNKSKVIGTKGGQKDKTKEKGSRPKSRITKPSGISVTIMTPISKPKQDKSKSKNNNADAMLSLIVGGKGTTADRMKEIKAEKTLEKKLGRRPSKKELVAYLKKK